MSRVIGRLPSTLEDNGPSENEHCVETDETISIFPCYNLYPKKSLRLSVSGNSEKLKSINLNCKNLVEDEIAPIKRKDARSIQNPFKKYSIPDEITEQIFSNLKKKDLLSAMLVCHRFYGIGHKSRNWIITDAQDRPISEISLIALSQRKIKVLRLAGAKADRILRADERLVEVALLSTSRLELLDLSRTNLTARQMQIMLKPCQKLKCLSIEGNQLDDHVAICIAENRGLRELDISMTNGITANGASLIFRNCKDLQQLNLAWCGLTQPIVTVIIHSIGEKLKKLNLSGTVRNFGINNKHIEILAAKSNYVTDLDLSDNVEISDPGLAVILNKFPRLTTISLNRCYGLDPNMVVHFNSKPSLVYLNVHGCVSDTNMELFLEMCSNLKVNRQYFNFTAKPVSYQCESNMIWGQTMMDIE
ncbi:F-box domain-containing protein [Caenorhabditis elegans]|uniref:F-box domain-containing protein n=1 Tax=Caenorhabditis elegans TaxID=6239 RepID=Q8MQ34_CAEEL|nr:F-box domain-containing protein [Caenorhabditis elegans]CCD71515.1 F-box domain-containing protein [Caenorhabditis elegans]|eukprot:NP_741136.1 SKP2 (S phase Kinase associated Protein Two) homolog [Caenorhabditis elegans]